MEPIISIAEGQKKYQDLVLWCIVSICSVFHWFPSWNILEISKKVNIKIKLKLIFKVLSYFLKANPWHNDEYIIILIIYKVY